MDETASYGDRIIYPSSEPADQNSDFEIAVKFDLKADQLPARVRSLSFPFSSQRPNDLGRPMGSFFELAISSSLNPPARVNLGGVGLTADSSRFKKIDLASRNVVINNTEVFVMFKFPANRGLVNAVGLELNGAPILPGHNFVRTPILSPDWLPLEALFALVNQNLGNFVVRMEVETRSGNPDSPANTTPLAWEYEICNGKDNNQDG